MHEHLFERYSTLFHEDVEENYQLRAGLLEEVGQRNETNTAFTIMSYKADKAVSYDGIRASSLDGDIRDMFTKAFWDRPGADMHRMCRLVHLNKAVGKIPTPEQVRPILISSSIIKLIEASILERLNLYQTHTSKFQVGFKQGRSTLDALIRVHS